MAQHTPAISSSETLNSSSPLPCTWPRTSTGRNCQHLTTPLNALQQIGHKISSRQVRRRLWGTVMGLSGDHSFSMIELTPLKILSLFPEVLSLRDTRGRATCLIGHKLTTLRTRHWTSRFEVQVCQRSIEVSRGLFS